MRESNPHLRAINSNNSSGSTGVYQQTGTTQWRVVFNRNGHRYNFGPFPSVLAASEARDKKIRALLREELYAS